MYRTVLTPGQLAAFVVVFAQSVLAQEEPVGGLFASQEVLQLTLETDLPALLNDRSQESQDRPAILRLPQEGGAWKEVPLQIRTRGRFRLQGHICSFPPVRLNFRETEPLGTIFDGQDKIKLVTHCHDRDSYEQNLLEEYLAYRIYNQLTEVSFRVRLAEMTYVDTSGEHDPFTRMAFLIEDEEALATRVNGMALEIPGARATAFEPDYMGTLFLFQYLIGNIDWSTANSQNLVVIRVGTDHFAVPYDFDWSGLVDAPYAGPSPLTERFHESVRERLYLGVCWEAIDFPKVFAHFQDRRESIRNLPEQVPRLSAANVRSALDYIAGFYEFLDNPLQAEADLGRMCRRG